MVITFLDYMIWDKEIVFVFSCSDILLLWSKAQEAPIIYSLRISLFSPKCDSKRILENPPTRMNAIIC